MPNRPTRDGGDQRNQRRDDRQEVAVVDKPLHYQERQELGRADQDEDDPMGTQDARGPPAPTDHQQHHEADDGGDLDGLKHRPRKNRRLRPGQGGGEAKWRKHVARENHPEPGQVDQASHHPDHRERSDAKGPHGVPVWDGGPQGEGGREWNQAQPKHRRQRKDRVSDVEL